MIERTNKFEFWVQRVLPQVYDESLSYYELLNKVVSFLNDVIAQTNGVTDFTEKELKEMRQDINDFLSNYEGNLAETIADTLGEWQSSGKLDVVIADGIQWELDDYKATNEQDKLAINQQLGEIDVVALKNRLAKKYRGSSVMLAYHPDETELTFSELLDKLTENNVNTVSICPRYWADNATSQIVGFRTSEIVDIPYIVDLCRQAKNKGFYVVLKPHVSGEGFTSYNSIKPQNTATFIQSYGDKVKELFTIAHPCVDILSVTNEMDNQTKVFPNLWGDLINQLRAIKPTVKLTNASRPDDLLSNVFLHRLDYIGANLYINIGGDLFTPVAEQERNMLKTSERINNAVNTALKYGKPLIVTEIGTQPYLTGLTNPESWAHDGGINYNYQSRYYEVVLKNLIESPVVAGTMIWQSAGAPLSGSFGFVNNPSETTVRKIYGGEPL